ncbi:hypothetical protein [Vibrio cholerae]
MSVISTLPLTGNESWQKIPVGEFVLFDRGLRIL